MSERSPCTVIENKLKKIKNVLNRSKVYDENFKSTG